VISSIKNKKINILLVSFIILYPWYLAISGIDMTDTGYWLVNYQHFFSSPTYVERAFPSWLSLFFGAVTNVILGGIGLFGFKIAYIITIYLSLWLVYGVLRTYTTSTVLLFCLSIALVFINIDRLSIINYNMLTTLFYLASAYFLYFALTKDKRNYFFIAGIILGLNIFIRFPNLLGITLVVVIFYYDFSVGNTKKDSLKRSAYVLLGYVFAIVSTLILMKTLGHFELYIERLSALLTSAKDPSYHHSGSFLLNSFIKNQFLAYMFGFVFITGILFLGWLSRFWNYSKVIMRSFTFLFSFIFIIFMMKISNIFNSPNYYFLHVGMIGITYLMLILIIFKNFRENPKFSLIALIALLIIELIPLGSDTHLRNALYGMYLVLPIILIYIYSLSSIKIGSFFLYKKEIVFLKYLISMTLIFFSVILSTMYFAAYGDSRVKFKMIATVDHPLLRYNLTTIERSAVLVEVLEKIQVYEKDYEYVLTYNFVPMIQYASKTRPYLGTATPFYYMPTSLKEKLKNAAEEKSLPLVVRAKTYAGEKEWPQGSPNLPKQGRLRENRQIMQDFLDSTGYIIVWESIDFELLIPSTKVNKL